MAPAHLVKRTTAAILVFVCLSGACSGRSGRSGSGPKPMSLEERVYRAELIVRGVATDKGHAFETATGDIRTDQRFVVREVLKGPTAEDLIVRHHGGVVGERRRQPFRFFLLPVERESIVMLIREGTSGDAYRPIGDAQGIFLVDGDVADNLFDEYFSVALPDLLDAIRRPRPPPWPAPDLAYQ